MPTIKIGGNTFGVVELPAMRTCELEPLVWPLLPDVAALCAVFLEEAPGLADKVVGAVGADTEVDASAIARAVPIVMPMLERVGVIIERIARKFPPGALSSLTRELLIGATMDGAQLFTANGDPYDLLMRGRTIDAWKLRLFALRVNFPDVFRIVPGASGSAGTVGPSAA